MLQWKKQLKQNNEREKLLTKENNKVLTDMVVYLRGSNLTEYNQELVRADLIEMVLDAQVRGDDIESVFGGRYQEICDEIMEAFPAKTWKEKVIDKVQTVAMVIWIFLFITMASEVPLMMIQKKPNFMVDISYGCIIGLIAIGSLSCFIVEHLTKNVFHQSKSGKLQFFKEWLLAFAVMTAIWGTLAIFDKTAVSIHMLTLTAIIVVTFIIDRMCGIAKER